MLAPSSSIREGLEITLYIAGPGAIPLKENSCVVVLCESWLRDVSSLGLKSLHAHEGAFV